MTRTLGPQDWGLRADGGGALMIGNFRAVDLARRHGTPLHVIHETRLEQTAFHFRRAFAAAYPGRTSVHYAFKCNSVPAVIQTVRRAGLEAEVMSEFELDLALALGYKGRDIVVNGPGKSASFLKKCLESGARLINVDSMSELELLHKTTEEVGQDARILLRINPDYVPHGMNSGTATGSRKGCAFGLDLKGGEAERALAALRDMKRVRFYGYHFHVGTGIREPKEYSRVLERLAPLIGRTRRAGIEIKVMDVGGGFASMTTREMTTGEFLVYQGLGRLPSGLPAGPGATFEDFGREIAGAPQEILLVLDSSIGQNALAQAREFLKFAGITGLFLTKLDGTAKGGSVISIVEELELPVKCIGVGEDAQDVLPFSPQEFVNALIS